jgi:plasmid stabilization system protein ParE
VDYKVLITDSALNDLKGIVLFIAEDDASAAVRVGERLIDRALSLGTMPARCPYHDSAQGIRKMTASPFQIYYNSDESHAVVHILHFWHAARLSPKF